MPNIQVDASGRLRVGADKRGRKKRRSSFMDRRAALACAVATAVGNRLRPVPASGIGTICGELILTPTSAPGKRVLTRLNSLACALPCQPVSYTHLRAHEPDSYLVCR